MRHRDRGRDRDRPSSAAAASTPTRTARYSKSGEAARSVGFNSEAAGADRVSGGCVRLPACQLPTGSSWWTSLSANSSIMLRSYSSIVSILSPRMPAMRSRRRVRVSGARRVRAVIFCEGLRGLREHNGEVVGDARAKCERRRALAAWLSADGDRRRSLRAASPPGREDELSGVSRGHRR